jgi:hypothetical protein
MFALVICVCLGYLERKPAIASEYRFLCTSRELPTLLQSLKTLSKGKVALEFD